MAQHNAAQQPNPHANTTDLTTSLTQAERKLVARQWSRCSATAWTALPTAW